MEREKREREREGEQEFWINFNIFCVINVKYKKIHGGLEEKEEKSNF